MAKITWLASYPKSGNTWIRVFLTNYLRNGIEPESINNLEETPIASSRHLFDEYSGVDSANLTAEEIDLLRPSVYRQYAKELAMQGIPHRYCKIHDAYTRLPNGQPMFPADVTAGAIYVIRNPLDVAVSYSNHNLCSPEVAIHNIGSSNHCLGIQRGSLTNQVHQRLLSWSQHVLTWTIDMPFPIHVIRYQDMIADPLAAFTALLRFTGGDLNKTRIQKAIQFSSIEVLQEQERISGFRERTQATTRFFRNGKVGSWTEFISPELAKRAIQDHREVMQKYGYLTSDGCLR